MLTSILTPMVLAFLLGVLAARIKSDLKFPDSLYQSLTIYLLIAIALKGGHKLSIASFSEVYQPASVAVLLCLAIPLWTFWIMRKAARLGVPDAAALAAHYGSVSAVTFSAALAFHETIGVSFEGFMPSLLAMMEIPAILVAISLARLNTSTDDGAHVSVREIARELLAGKSSLLLIGFLVIGYVIGETGWEQVAPLFDVPFKGVLTLFLLEAGLVAGRRLSDLRQGGWFLVAFGVVFPVLHATLGIFLGSLAGLSLGGATILGVLAASASYIAAPAACRVALPEANPSYYLTAALAITFPFNIMIGLPLYHEIARYMFE
ncbi:MAG: sodium-dependent bicarbonate transport family permease [Cyclobacteriaceae bacterium]|nr:sodium-dependent bicarbonate transport family permease [Cyclobacteriaceae bacterium]